MSTPVRECRQCKKLKLVEGEFRSPRDRICTVCKAAREVDAEQTAARKAKAIQAKKEDVRRREYNRTYYREYMRKRIGVKNPQGPQKSTKKKDAKDRKKLNELNRKKQALLKQVVEEKQEKPKEIAKKVLKQTPAAAELAARELCRRRLIHFIKRYNRKYTDGWVHRLICERLEQFMRDIEAQKGPRLMIFMPPRHGKSEIASKNYPAWVLGHHPDWEIIASSYAVSLPLGFSRKVRGLVADPYYRSLFPKCALSRESTSAENWLTTSGGGYVAAGVGGGITGKGAHLFIIDDPVKDAQEADSETMRDSAWDWYGSTAKTRLSPGGGMLVIQTRWHDDDLSGRLLTQMNEQRGELEDHIREAQRRLKQEGDADVRKQIHYEIEALRSELTELDHWEVIIFPAIATEDEYLSKEQHICLGTDLSEEDLTGGQYELLRNAGDALHEVRFPVGRLRNMKRTMQPRHWSALYQQNPVPDEGIYFRKDMFRMEPVIPDYRLMKTFIAADLAMSKKERGDWSVFSVGALDYEDQIHVLDVIRVKQDTNDLVETILTLVRKFKPEMVGLEKGQYEIAIKPQLNKRMREERLFFTLAEGDYALKPITDKETRARPLQGRMQQGMVLFPENQPWLEGVVYELLRFPGGMHDDIVDSLAWLARLVMMHEPPRKQRVKPHKSWRDKIRDSNRGDKHYMGA